MKTPRLLCFLSCTLLAPAAPLCFADTYSFTLDGGPCEPGILPVMGERKGAPGPGDIGWVGEFPFVLQQPGAYHFRIGGEEDTQLFCRVDDGPERCVGVLVKESEAGEDPFGDADDEPEQEVDDLAGKDDTDEDPPPLLDSLAGMTADEKKALWGIAVEDPSAGWLKTLDGIDWSRTALAIEFKWIRDLSQPAPLDDPDSTSLELDSSRSGSPPLPALPTGLRYLSININSSPSFSGLDSLKDLADLRYLDVDLFGATLDCAALENARHLRNLSLRSGEIENGDRLANLTEMRFLKIRGTDGLDSVAFARGMPNLRVLKVDRTAVSDLRPLAACPELRLLSGTAAAIEHLPDPSRLPALRDLRLLSTPAGRDDAAIAAFREATPECRVRAGWHETLLASLDRTDRLRVRSGGTCHRNPATEETLFVMRDAGRIEALVKSLEIDEERSGFHCMCCGDPSLEFYRGDELLATLGFHHGQSLRWSGGLWPGDAAITLNSAALLCDVMADEGYDAPQRQLNEQKSRREAERRYWNAVFEIAPEAFVRSLWEALDEDPVLPEEEVAADPPSSAIALVTKQWPDAGTRAAKILSLYGAVPQQSWNRSVGLDSALNETLVPPVADRIPSLLAAASDNRQLMQGIARWCLFDREGEETREALDGNAFKALIDWALRHPRADNRIQALLALNSERGEPLLIAFLDNAPAPRVMPKDAEQEPGGGVTYLPRKIDIPDGAGDRAAAALILSSRNCLPARDTISRLAAEAPEDQRPIYKLALEGFRQIPGR